MHNKNEKLRRRLKFSHNIDKIILLGNKTKFCEIQIAMGSNSESKFTT